MKAYLILALCVGAAFAGISFDFESNNKYGSVQKHHFDQHRQTVEEAKRIASQKFGEGLSPEAFTGNNYGALESAFASSSALKSKKFASLGTAANPVFIPVVAPDCEPHSESSNHAENIGNQHVIKLASGSNSYSESLQSQSSVSQAPVYVAGGSSGLENYVQLEKHVENQSPVIVAPISSINSESYVQQQSLSQQQSVPVVIPLISRGSENYYHREEHKQEESAVKSEDCNQQHISKNTENIGNQHVINLAGGSESYESQSSVNQAPVSVAGGSSGSEVYVQHEKHVENQAPVIVAPVSSSNSESYVRQQSHSQQQSAPVVIPSTSSGYEKKYYHHEEHKQEQSAPIIIPTTGGKSENYYHHEQQSQHQQSVPIILPSTGSSSKNYIRHQQEQHTQQSAVPLVIPTAEKYYHHEQHEQHSQSQNPIPIIYQHQPSSASESTYHNVRHIENKAAPIVVAPIVVAPTIRGSSNNFVRQNEKIVESNFAPIGFPSRQITIPSPMLTIPSTGSSSSFSRLESNYNMNNQQPKFVYTAPSVGSHSSYAHSSSSSSNSGSSIFPVSGGLKSSSLFSDSSSRGLNSKILGGKISSLDAYMSESERLARLQAGGLENGGIRHGSDILLGSLRSNNGSGVSGGNNNYSKSWEKSSKWASGSQWGDNMKTKSYNYLSDGEAENVNINGKVAGYKAATTTLDNDGKVSTYSIHT